MAEGRWIMALLGFKASAGSLVSDDILVDIPFCRSCTNSYDCREQHNYATFDLKNTYLQWRSRDTQQRITLTYGTPLNHATSLYLHNNLESGLNHKARLARSFLHDRLLIVLEGFDIFHQLKNITHVMTSDVITNTRTNVIPSYAIICGVYRLNYKKVSNKDKVHWF